LIAVEKDSLQVLTTTGLQSVPPQGLPKDFDPRSLGPLDAGVWHAPAAPSPSVDQDDSIEATRPRTP
jgi:hypothetical protein